MSTDIIQIISTVGFPIFACVMMYRTQTTILNDIKSSINELIAILKNDIMK